MSYPRNTTPVRPYSADLAVYHDAHVRAYAARTTFNGGQLYRTSDGRRFFVMSGNSRTVDVWLHVEQGPHLRVGEMSRYAFATLVGR